LPLATVEANFLGQIRTGAASGVATKYLARPDADVLGVIGSGFQAETQIAAISCVRKLREVRVWSRKAERRSEFARKCTAKFGLDVRASQSAREAVEGAGIVVTATSSKEPVLESAWISAGTHINAMGSNWTIKRELPTDLVMDRADFVAVDSVEDACLESGDLTIPLLERPGADMRGVDLCQCITGARTGRTSPDEITIFKSNGLAAQDVAVAGYVYSRLFS
jgi:ornithine cyclodeaminase/alanine dehydrogenase-like protein (mu-crystallin family)